MIWLLFKINGTLKSQFKFNTQLLFMMLSIQKFNLPLPNLCELFSHIVVAKVMNCDSVCVHNHKFTDFFV